MIALAALLLLVPLDRVARPVEPAPIGLPTGAPTCAAPATAPAAAAVAAPVNPKALKALAEWLKTYRGGKIDVASRADNERKSLARKYGLIDDTYTDVLTAQRDLQILVDAVAAQDSEAAAELLLETASVGLDDGRVKYTFEMAPYVVREAGEAGLARLTAAEALGYIEKVVRGDIRTDKAYGDGVRAAAMRFVGDRKNAGMRETLQQQLGAGSVTLRLAAAEALGKLADVASADALTAALDRETEEAVLGALVDALRKCFADVARKGSGGGDGDSVAEAPKSASLAVRAAIRALGRTSWRADMQLIEFLGDFRSAETVPALIDVLQRFVDNPQDVESGKLSGLLQHRVHETLVAMTGAVFPADNPGQWREFWDREKTAVLAAPPQRSRPANSDGSGTAVKGFFGIPVEGTRVLFVIDLSGSMEFDMPGGKEKRLDYAKQRLHEVLDKLPEVCRMNFITYNGTNSAKVWAKEMIKAEGKNKDRARKFVDEMSAVGGTNMWAGLQEALKMKSLIYGDRYETAVDEMFILSDGEPTVGEITDTLEILRLVTETNRFSKVRINTVFITSPDDHQPAARNAPRQSMKPEEFMRRMAEENGGRFIEIR